jgi:CheY-like chemotaxis protein
VIWRTALSSRTEPQSGHLPIGTFPAISDIPTGHEAMRHRIVELEALCAEVYEAAVVLGLPDSLLAKLWMVAAHGNHPQRFMLSAPDTPEPPIVDIPLVHRPSAYLVTPPELPELTERRTVMVVEDDPAMLDLIMRILSTENYDLLSAESGTAALERLKQDELTPDLLITDLMMPGLSGSQLAASLRRRTPTLRVLYETGFTDSLFKAKQELEPGAAFIEKPFSARGLLEAARFALFGTLNPDAARATDTPPRQGWSLPRLVKTTERVRS